MGHYADSALEYFWNRSYRNKPIKRIYNLATSYLNIVGKARFIKNIFEPDEAFGASKFKAGIWLDEENQKKFYQSGIQAGYQQEDKEYFGVKGDPTKLKEDENGPYVILSRDDMKMINRTLVYFTPPYIKNKDLSYRVSYVDPEGNLVRQYQDPNKKKEIRMEGAPFLIGNGSLIELNICVFDTKTKGKGHRLEGIRILDLIEYRPKDKEATVTTADEIEDLVIPEVPEVIVSKFKKKVVPF